MVGGNVCLKQLGEGGGLGMGGWGMFGFVVVLEAVLLIYVIAYLFIVIFL